MNWLWCFVPMCVAGALFAVALAIGMCQAAGRTDAWLDEFERMQKERMK